MRKRRLGMVCLMGAALLAASLVPAMAQDHSTVVRPDTVAARLGGFPGIFAFLEKYVVPVELTDPITAPFFKNLTETGGDIETCLAMLLDHDLGGSSAHFGAVLPNGHKCRSSMTEIHRGRAISDPVIDRFIAIVGEQATVVGVAPADIAQVAKVLERYRGGVRRVDGDGKDNSGSGKSNSISGSHNSGSGNVGALDKGSDDGMVIRPDTVAAHLGGFNGILAFLTSKVVPAELADPVTGPFFNHLTETGGDIETCLAMLLDHDLGGSSAHFGAVLSDGHQCRSSMTDIHRGREITDPAVDRFIAIVGEQAKMAGVPDADIDAVAKVLGRYRGGVRNK